jgi:LAO/AO transport system kinase
LTGSANVDRLVEALLAGSERGVARACRAIDDALPGHVELLIALYPHTGKAVRIGITGNPGAGKSTLTDRLIGLYRQAGKRIGVVAVDPTSPFTGGAILGDRIRMPGHEGDPGVFIRSLATRGAMGGLSRTALDVVRVLEAWGADVVLIETVGVGQDELDVAAIANTTLVIAPPGLGDEVQAVKAGLLECADVFAVNKADRAGAEVTVRDLEGMIALGQLTLAAPQAGLGGSSHGHGAGGYAAQAPSSSTTWVPPVKSTVATTGQGLPELLDALEAHRTWFEHHGTDRRRQTLRQELLARFRGQLWHRLGAAVDGDIEHAVTRIMSGAADPYSESQALCDAYPIGR